MRTRAIETGEQIVVGMNAYTETEPSPLTADSDRSVLKLDESAEREQIERLRAFRQRRNDDSQCGTPCGTFATSSRAAAT